MLDWRPVAREKRSPQGPRPAINSGGVHIVTKYNWKEQRDKRAFLALEDGSVYHGYSVGAEADVLGEVVFNTGMTGYQEILSDPSYAGQIVTMTYPEIGSTGMNSSDMESRKLFANGFIIHDLNHPSNWRSESPLSAELLKNKIPCIAGIDTRALTTKLRSAGTLKGMMAASGTLSEKDAVAKAREWCGLDGQDYAAKVTCRSAYDWNPEDSLDDSWGVCDKLPPADMNVVALDYGIKRNIMRNLRRCGMKVHVMPAKTTATELLGKKPDGVFISNGPADPAALPYAVETIRAVLGKIPVFGICLGHQLLGLACGAKTRRLKFGHHGCNHPVMRLENRKVEITSQNHNFIVDDKSLDLSQVEITHVNLNDNTVEGIRHRKLPAFSVQYHPEAGPGPHDPFYLFREFRRMMESR